MGTSEKAFNQVKAILSKLDRNIDELRDKRLHPQAATLVGAEPMPVVPAVVKPVIPTAGAAPTTNGRPTFGRAQPIRTDRL